MKDKPIERHWADNHITLEFVAWDESGSNQIGVYTTRKEARQALIEYAKTLNKEESL